jgi:membrane dipeptidase
MFIVDAHQDIAFNTVCYGRDYRLSALKKREAEANTPTAQKAGRAMLGLPEAIIGRVAVVFATVFTEPRGKVPAFGNDAALYSNPQQAMKAGEAQLDVYKRLSDEEPRLRLINTHADLEAVLATWADDVPVTQRVQGLVLLMENADPILEPRQFEWWYERGVRVVGPAWRGTRYCGGTGEPGKLTPLGRELLDVMMNFNAILDLSHMAEESYLEALDHYEGVIIASHSNPRHFRNSDRHLSDMMIRRLAERGGVMGIVPYNLFLSNHWSLADGKSAIKLNRVLEAIDYVCQLVGSAEHVGIGTDFDGGFGSESTPQELNTVADLWVLKDALLTRGYPEADVTNILGGNMLRQLRTSLKGR